MMDIKSSIRHRRQERIRTIQSRALSYQAPAVPPEQPALRQPEQLDQLGRPERSERDWQGERQHDPEYAWRQREQQLLSEWKGGPPGAGGWRPLPTRGQLWTKLLICAALYGMTYGLFQMQTEWASDAKRWVRAALTDDMKMDAVAAWYNRTFSGAPSFIPAFLTKHKEADQAVSAVNRTFRTPVTGKVAKGFASGHPYVELSTAADASVYAMDEGLVVFAGVQDGLGYSLTIQHAGGFQSTYSGLRAGKWVKNDWINPDDMIGTAAPGSDGAGHVTFSVTKDGTYVNPADVVSIG